MISTDKFRKAMRDIAAQKGDFSFYGLLLRADAPGTWDPVVSAPWLEARRLKPLGELTELLAKSIGRQSLRQLARVVILNERDPSFKKVVSSYSVDDGEVRVHHSNLFGLDIEDAIIMRAKKAA